MAKGEKTKRTKARRLKGFRDITAVDVLARTRMIDRIRTVYERYGFIPLETPALEYVDALGKYLPEADQPDGGIFALRDDNDEGLKLGKQRLDSTHIRSNMAVLTRLSRFTHTITAFVKKLRKQHPRLFEALPPGVHDNAVDLGLYRRHLACSVRDHEAG